MDVQGGVWKGIRHVKTCTECKQAKLRCDARDKFPGPCSRCEERKLSCSVDPTFRRMPARKRLEAMSKELQELRQQHRESDDARATSVTASASATSQSNGDGGELLLELSIADHDLEFDPSVLSLQIGQAIISRQVAVDSFRLFTTHFHPHLPIAGTISINTCYQNSSLLFWTIIAITTSRLPSLFEEGVFRQLENPFSRLLRQEALISPLPLQKIHALLYLCTWPLPTQYQVDDPSWLYSGLAVNAARYMGLHRPTPPPGPLRSIGTAIGNIPSRAYTWLACFCTDNRLAMYAGLPPLINSSSDLGTIRQLMTEFPIPKEFEINLRLRLALSSVTSNVFNSGSDVVDSSLVQLLDAELNGLKGTLTERWPEIDEIAILSAQLHTYVMVITKNQTSKQSRDILLKIGFAAAIRIVHLMLRFAQHEPSGMDPEQPDATNLTPQQKYRTLPKGVFRETVFAVIFLLRFFLLDESSSSEERQLAIRHVTMAQTLFESTSVEPLDELARAAAFFKALGRAPPIQGDTTKLSRWLTDRMGAGIVLDGLRIAAEVRGRPLHMNEEEESRSQSQSLSPGNILAPEGAMGPDEDVLVSNTSLTASSDLWYAGTENIDYYNQFWSTAAWNMLNYDSVMGPQQGL